MAQRKPRYSSPEVVTVLETYRVLRMSRQRGRVMANATPEDRFRDGELLSRIPDGPLCSRGCDDPAVTTCPACGAPFCDDHYRDHVQEAPEMSVCNREWGTY